MLKGNCAQKLDSCGDRVSDSLRIQPKIVDLWLKKHPSCPKGNEATNPVMMTCMSPFG